MEKINFTDFPDDSTRVNAENLNKLQDNVETGINGVVESGSNENGSWTKWADGTMICTKSVEGTTNFSTAWGSLYESSSISLGNYAMPFAEKPKVTITNNKYTGYWLENHSEQGTSNAGRVTLLRPNSYNNATYGLDIIAIGKWK